LGRLALAQHKKFLCAIVRHRCAIAYPWRAIDCAIVAPSGEEWRRKISALTVCFQFAFLGRGP